MKIRKIKSASALLAAFGLLAFSLPAYAQQAAPTSVVQTNRQSDEGPAKNRTPRTGLMSSEEKIVRDVYARLMRYHTAARDEQAATTGVSYRPEDYVVFELRNIHSGPIDEIAARPLAEVVTTPTGEVLSVTAHHLQYGNGPKHSSYDVAWSSSPSTAPYNDRLTVTEMLASGGDPLLDIVRYTSFEVTIRLAGKERTYRAIALHHNDADSTGKPRAEILDNVTAEINAVLADESPRVRSPWKTYVKSSLYLAVAKQVSKTEKAGKPLIPADAAIGYLPGDDAKANSDSQMIAVACLPTTIDILQDGVIITNTTRNVIVGQRISLSVAVSPSGTTTTHNQWTIPGTRIANYVVQFTTEIAPTSAVVTPLTNLTTTSLDFYWVDGEDSRQVTFSCKIGGQSYSVQATFNVKRPTATFASTSGASVTLDSACNGFLSLRYGCSAHAFGVRFSTTSLVIPSGFSGDTQLVQIVDSTERMLVKINSTKMRLSGAGVLDTSFPYGIDWDAPKQPLDPDDVRAKASDSFTMYLIFKPSTPNSIWVPLRRLSWSWSGDGLYDGTLTASSHSPSQTGVDVTVHPQWSANVTSLTFHREVMTIGVGLPRQGGER